MRDSFAKIRRHLSQISKYVVSLLLCFAFFASADFLAGRLFSRPLVPEKTVDSVEEAADVVPPDSGAAGRGLASIREKRSSSALAYEPGSSGYAGRPDDRLAVPAGGTEPIAVDPGAETSAAQDGASPLAAVEPAKTSGKSPVATATDEAGSSAVIVGGGYVAPSTDTSTSTTTSTTTSASASLVWGTGTWGSGLWGP